MLTRHNESSLKRFKTTKGIYNVASNNLGILWYVFLGGAMCRGRYRRLLWMVSSPQANRD